MRDWFIVIAPFFSLHIFFKVWCKTVLFALKWPCVVDMDIEIWGLTHLYSPPPNPLHTHTHTHTHRWKVIFENVFAMIIIIIKDILWCTWPNKEYNSTSTYNSKSLSNRIIDTHTYMHACTLFTERTIGQKDGGKREKLCWKRWDFRAYLDNIWDSEWQRGTSMWEWSLTKCL